MILYSNGCSFTYGGGLEPYFEINNILDEDKRQTLVWPHHLSILLNATKVVNLAAGCGSNSRIVRTTLNWIKTCNKTDLSNSVAVLQFTDWPRFEMYNKLNVNDEYENIENRWLKCKIDMAMFSGSRMDFLENQNEITKFVNKKIALETAVVWIYNTLSQLYALKGIFDTYGLKKYYFWHLYQGWNYWPNTFKNELFENFNILDKNEKWDYERISKVDKHPSIVGHKQLASLIFQKIGQFNYA